MQRNFLRGFLICLIPCLLAGAVVGMAGVKYARNEGGFRLGIDLAGGTILVYEVNQERLKDRKRTEGGTANPNAPAPELTSEEMNQLAAQIKRRIDPTDIKNVTVRPLGRTRFEIILPTGSGAGGGKEKVTADYIDEVKRLISQMGVLEFRILANGTDDAEGMREAVAAANARTPEEAALAAKEGRAPEGPAGKFSVDINDTKGKVEYRWVGLGPEYRSDLGLSNVHEGQPGGLWAAAARNRGKAFLVAATEHGYAETPDPKAAALALYSREVNKNSPDAAREVDAARKAVAAGKLPESLLKNPDGSTKADGQIYEAILASPEAVKELNPKRFEYFVLTRVTPRDARPEDGQDSLKVGGDITLNATAGTDPKTFNPSVEFTFNAAGANQFSKITRRNKPTGGFKRHLAIVLDEKIASAPTLDSEIGARGQITGKFDRKKVEDLVKILRSGALSAELKDKAVSENTIGPTLGRDTIQKGTTAVGLAFIAILVFMVIYYRFAGFVASIALFANLLLTIGFMVAVNAAFTLPGLAGLVLTLGMAVDANVLIYERLREERDKGANLITAIRNGYDRAFLTIIDTHLTSIFTAIVLYTFGNDQLKGFAISLTVGLVISLFTSLYMTRLMFDYWQHRGWLTNLRMMRLFGRINVHPMKYRWFFLPFTAVLTVAGLAVFLYRGDAGLNVDFRGGTVIGGVLKEGEERALIATPDGKKGFRELLSEAAQKERLNPVSAAWNNKPIPKDTQKGLTPDEIATVNKFDYTITYADGSTAAVTLSQKPAGNTEREMEIDLVGDPAAGTRGRAGQLPDVSVEQTFRQGTSFPDGKSRLFTIRTTEKQPELVRVSLDRLLRDDSGKSLLAGATMDYKEAPGKVKDRSGKDVAVPLAPGGVVELTFSEPTSKGYVQELLEREFRTALGRGSEAGRFTLTGDEAGKSEGRFTKMLLNVSADPAFDQLLPAAGVTPDAAKKNEQLADLGKVLASARQAFNASPEPERLEVFDSQLAGETRNKALYAILASWIAILLYLWFRFGNWTFGLAAVLCLVHDLCFTLGAIAACHFLHLIPGTGILLIEDFKIDLAAVAALLTLVGYSVNEIIVNFARLREVRGKNPRLTPDMINTSVSQTLSRTILTSMTVFLVSIVLYIFGGEGVHLFAFVMMMGVLISTYSSIFVASPLLLIFGEGREDTAETTGDEEPADKEGKEEEEVVEG